MVDGNGAVDQLGPEGFEFAVVQVLEGSGKDLGEEEHLEVGEGVAEVGFFSFDESALEVAEVDFSVVGIEFDSF